MSTTANPSNSTREEALLVALLAGKTVCQAAEATGIPRRTAYRIRGKESFQRRLREAKSELLGSAVAKLHGHAFDFVEALHKIATDSNARGSERATAAREGLAAMFKGVEIFEFEERIRRLEQAAVGEGEK